MNPANGGIIYFTEVSKKACFREKLKENKYNPHPGLLQPLQQSLVQLVSRIYLAFERIVLDGRLVEAVDRRLLFLQRLQQPLMLAAGRQEVAFGNWCSTSLNPPSILSLAFGSGCRSAGGFAFVSVRVSRPLRFV